MSLRIAATLLLSGTLLAAVHKGGKGTVYIPDDLKPNEVVPVLIVEGGLAESFGKLWPAVSKRTRAVVVETVPLRQLIRHRDALQLVNDAMLDALREGNRHHDLNRCPWIVVGFSAAARKMGHIALRDAQRYQGLLLVNAGLQPRDFPPKLEEARNQRVAILNGSRDPYVTAGQAMALQGKLKERGIEAGFGTVETSDHMAPMGELGADFVAAYLKEFASDPVEGRTVPVAPRTIETAAPDGLKLTADLYETGRKEEPIVLLFHQARSSRGEYKTIAPRLVEEGYNCLALDQRSGATWAGVENETAKRAAAQGKAQQYTDARQDVERAVAWARELGFSGPLTIVGSSYSASLVIFVGAETEGVDAIVSFSPGDYLRPRGSIYEAAAKLTVPTLIICPGNEEKQARPIYEKIGSANKSITVEGQGVHGASTLYRSATPKVSWNALIDFLDLYIKKQAHKVK